MERRLKGIKKTRILTKKPTVHEQLVFLLGEKSFFKINSCKIIARFIKFLITRSNLLKYFVTF